jgi:hypothetical protein
MSDTLLRQVLAPHLRRSLFLDSNLLLLLVAGLMGPTLFSHFKRAGLTFEDAVLVRAIAAKFRACLTTPSVLAETSNLGGYAPSETATAFRSLLAAWIGTSLEALRPSTAVTPRRTYAMHGFTDATIALLAETEDAVVLTADVQLFLELETLGLPCINFRHLQAMRLLG